MLAEHMFQMLQTAFPDDVITEIVGTVPKADVPKVSIILNCPEGVDPELRYETDPYMFESAVGIVVGSRKFNTTEYALRTKTREIMNLFDIKNLTDEQRIFTDGDVSYKIRQMNTTTQTYGVTEDEYFASDITINVTYQIY